MNATPTTPNRPNASTTLFPGVAIVIALVLTSWPALSGSELFSNNPWLATAVVTSSTLLATALSWHLLARHRDRILVQDQKLAEQITNRMKISSARLADNGKIVDANSLKAGERILVLAGESIPRDGHVLKGTTSVDESPLTGEYRPRLKEKGSLVYGGSLNRDGEILVELNNAPGSDAADALLKKLSGALNSTDASSNQNSKPTALAIFLVIAAIGAALYLIFIRHFDGPHAISAALGALVVFPWTFSALPKLATTRFLISCAHRGVLIASGKALETLSRLHAMFFNKTGTLTGGNFLFSEVNIEPGTNLGRFLMAAFSVEAFSEHPLARAMETHPWYVEIPKVKVRRFESHPGLGACAEICPPGEKPFFVAVGNVRFLKRLQFQISRELRAKADELELAGDTVTLVAYDRYARGVLSFSDMPRRGVRRTLRFIRKIGIETALLTGDTEKTLQLMTERLGIEKTYTRCTPEEKVTRIAKEKEAGRLIGVVANDAESEPVLAAANLSVSLDTGPDISKRSADVLVMGATFDRLGDVVGSARTHFKNLSLISAGGMIIAGLGVVCAFSGVVPPTIPALLSFVWSTFSLAMCENMVLGGNPAPTVKPQN